MYFCKEKQVELYAHITHYYIRNYIRKLSSSYDGLHWYR